MSELRAAEEAFAQQASTEPTKRTGLGKDINNKVVALFDSLPQIWANDTTTDAHRKALLRCLIEKVVLDQNERDIALARVVWRGAPLTGHEVKMKVNSVAKLMRGEEMRARLLELARMVCLMTRSPRRSRAKGTTRPIARVLPITVQRVRLDGGIKAAAQRTRWTHEPPLLSTVQLASRLNIPVIGFTCKSDRNASSSISNRTGHICSKIRLPSIEAVRDLRNHAISGLDLRIIRLHQEGHQHINNLAVLVQETMALDPFSPAVLRSAIAVATG